ncbi:hypothetical protein [Streptomyces sp. NPDC051014]|uniref:hypothetical protein n=1 Tax=Streptomyces sp. NPDC051014 TaxID=3155751 RepID=UPI0033E1D4EF
MAASQLVYAARMVRYPGQIPSEAHEDPGLYTASLLSEELLPWSEHWSVVQKEGFSLAEWFVRTDQSLRQTFFVDLFGHLGNPDRQVEYIGANEALCAQFAQCLVNDFFPQLQNLLMGAAASGADLPVPDTRADESSSRASKGKSQRDRTRREKRRVDFAKTLTADDGQEEADLSSRDSNLAWNRDRLKAAEIGVPLPFIVYAAEREGKRGGGRKRFLLDHRSADVPRLDYSETKVTALAEGLLTVIERGHGLSPGKVEYSISFLDERHRVDVLRCIDAEVGKITKKKRSAS